MPLNPVVTEVERLLFRSDLVAAGAFRCPSRHALYNDSGPASGHLFVFPRTSTRILFSGRETVTATPPTALFYNAGQVYTRRKIDEIDASDWFMVDEAVVRDVVGRYDASAAGRETRIFPFASGHVSGRVYMAQRRVHQRLAAGDPADPLSVEESIINLLHASVRDAFGATPRRAGTSPARREAVETVKSLIAARPAANLSLAELAAAARCSPYQLCRFFRSETGYTITQFKHALRLRIALDVLRRGRSDVTDIALSLGYASHSHFTLSFRRHFGMTPSEFRSSQTFCRRGLPAAVPDDGRDTTVRPLSDPSAQQLTTEVSATNISHQRS